MNAYRRFSHPTFEFVSATIISLLPMPNGLTENPGYFRLTCKQSFTQEYSYVCTFQAFICVRALKAYCMLVMFAIFHTFTTAQITKNARRF
jgi:hypothetical protein